MAVRIKPYADGTSLGPWQVVGAVTRAGALGAAVPSDGTYVTITDPRVGHNFNVKIRAAPHPPLSGGQRIEVRCRRLSGELQASLRLALFEGEPGGGGAPAFESEEVPVRGGDWRTVRLDFDEDAWEAIADFGDLWVRVRVVWAIDDGELAISGLVGHAGNEADRKWKRADKSVPTPPKQMSVLDGDGDEYVGVKFNGEWAFDDDTAFENASRYVAFWSDE